MGFFASLMGWTRTGKYMAAKNALLAKYAFQNLDDVMKKKVDNKILQMLIEGGFSPESALRRRGIMCETQYFGLAAFALDSFGILPPLKNICSKDYWEPVNNPLIALDDAEKEIKTASDEIMKKYNIPIMVSEVVEVKSQDAV